MRRLPRPGRNVAWTLLFGTVGGAVATALGLPVGWLLGSTVAVVIAALSGFPVAFPNALRDVVFFILGVQAGSGVTPEVMGQIALWPASFAIQMAGVAAVVFGSALFLRKVLGWDRETALFASIPGALSFVLAAASDTRADMTKIIIVQSVRLLLLIAFLTPVLSVLESSGGDVGQAAQRGGAGGGLVEYAILVAVCLVLAWLGVRSRLPGGLILGALVGSAVLHATEIAPVPVPQWLVVPSLVGIGVAIASRIRPQDRFHMMPLLPASLASFAIGLSLSAVAGLAAVLFLGLHLGTVALAYAPGALEALTVLAYQFDLDPAYVAAHHVVRFLGLAVLVPLFARRMPRRPTSLGTPPPPRAEDAAPGREED